MFAPWRLRPGFSLLNQNQTASGVDLLISATREIDGDFPSIMVQVKSWSVPIERPGAWRYDRLTQKQFNALAGGNRRFPRYLFVVIVPSDSRRYANVGEDALGLSHAAYWVSLANNEKIQDASSKRRIPITIPRENLLTIESLVALCEGSQVPGRRAS